MIDGDDLGLTGRYWRIACLVAEGWTNAEIASDLHRSGADLATDLIVIYTYLQLRGNVQGRTTVRCELAHLVGVYQAGGMAAVRRLCPAFQGG